MKKSLLLGAVCACFVVLPFNASAVVLNTLNGIDYEWLELTETTGQSRLQVEGQLMDANSPLYGYQYASRSLIEDLFLSYTSWDGLNGWHTAPDVVLGVEKMIYDFGITNTIVPDETGTIYSLEGTYVYWDASPSSRGIYGLSSECGSATSCFSQVAISTHNGTPTAAYQDAGYGFDATIPILSGTDNNASHTNLAAT